MQQLLHSPHLTWLFLHFDFMDDSMKRFARMASVAAAIVAVVLIGGYLALRRPDVSFATLEVKYADETSKYVALSDGVRLHYRDRGNSAGKTLLFIHGQGASSESWHAWSRELTAEFRVISIDLPGHGLTRAPESYEPSMTKLAALVDEFAVAISLDRFAIVGHSMGGHVAWTYAHAYPSRANALVLIASGGLRPPGSGGSLSVMASMMSVLKPVLADLDPLIGLRMSMKASLGNEAVSDAALNRAAEIACAPGHREIALAIHLSRTKEADVMQDERKLAGIKVPTLILWGQQDAVAPSLYADRFARLIPNAEIVTYPGVGHVPQIEVGARSAADLRTFLQTKTAQL